MTHTTKLEDHPGIACIWDRLLEIAKRPSVQTTREETHIGVNHVFYFETGNAPHAIGILIGDDELFTYSNSAWSPNLTLPELRAAQQSLVDVDNALDGKCNLGGLLDNMRRSCFGTNCDRLVTENN